MRVRVKLFAMLSGYLPPGSTDNETELELDTGTTVGGVTKRLGLADEVCHLVLVNGLYVEPSARDGHVLLDGDALAIWPPVAGG